MTRELQVDGLRYTYPDGRQALSGVDLVAETGERVALLGPNGAGKTTLSLHLNGILTADQGEVHIGDLRLEPDSLDEIRRRVGLVFQNPDDQLFMPTVGQDVAFGPANLGLSGTDLDDRVQTALEAVDAADLSDRAPHHLSGGERRRVAVATALAMEPAILVLDEPTSGLDPTGRRELASVLTRLPITQLIITHDLPFALELCGRSVIMNGGRVAADGATPAILANTALLRANRLEMPFGYDTSALGLGDAAGG